MGSKFKGATLENIKFKDTNLTHVDLSGATLNHIKFKDSDLKDVNLKGATLTNVKFKGTNLNDLSGAHLTNVSIDGKVITSPDQLQALGIKADGVIFNGASPEFHAEVKKEAAQDAVNDVTKVAFSWNKQIGPNAVPAPAPTAGIDASMDQNRDIAKAPVQQEPAPKLAIAGISGGHDVAHQDGPSAGLAVAMMPKVQPAPSQGQSMVPSRNG